MPLPVNVVHVSIGQLAGLRRVADDYEAGKITCGLSMVAAGKTRRNIAVAALFLGTAAAYYCVPGNPQVRVWLMWWQCACYLAMLF